MGGFDTKVKVRAYEVKQFFKKGFKTVAYSCKKGWFKVKHLKK